ncbi:MAG TPA: DinB family protein [Thermomicrobiales bacterium]|jgi:hypothetical protein
MMATRAEQLATQFAAINDEISALISGCTDEQWRQPCADEVRPVGVVAHHTAIVQQAFTGMVATLVAGETYSPQTSMETIDQLNAQHAREHAEVGKEETLGILCASEATIAQQIRSLDDAQLDRTAGVFGGNELTVAQVIAMVVIGHAGSHLASIRATVAG